MNAVFDSSQKDLQTMNSKRLAVFAASYVNAAGADTRLGSVQTGKLLLIGQRLVVVQTGWPHGHAHHKAK